MTYTEIRYEVDGDVGILTLNRPEARNALTFTTYAELEDAVRTTSARCLVITGADPAFCSGDDVKQIMVQAGERASQGLRAEPRLTPAADALLGTDVPIIAAVNGAAVGWGMELAVMADIRVASEQGQVWRAVRQARSELRCSRSGPSGLAGGQGGGRGTALHRPDRRRPYRQGTPPGIQSRSPRGSDAHGYGAGPGDRGQPPAGGAKAEAGIAAGPRSGLGRPRTMGQRQPG